MTVMARGKNPNSIQALKKGSEKKTGRAVRGFTIRFPDAETEVRFDKFVEEFDGTKPEALGAILRDYLKDTY